MWRLFRITLLGRLYAVCASIRPLGRNLQVRHFHACHFALNVQVNATYLQVPICGHRKRPILGDSDGTLDRNLRVRTYIPATFRGRFQLKIILGFFFLPTRIGVFFFARPV